VKESSKFEDMVNEYRATQIQSVTGPKSDIDPKTGVSKDCKRWENGKLVPCKVKGKDRHAHMRSESNDEEDKKGEEAIEAVKKKFKIHSKKDPLNPPHVSDEEGEAALNAVKKKFARKPKKESIRATQLILPSFKIFYEDHHKTDLAKAKKDCERRGGDWYWCDKSNKCKLRDSGGWRTGSAMEG